MRRGIFGGTFDPPHVGHLMVASDACDALGLDRLTFVPNARQPLKADTTAAAPEHRLAMVRRAIDGDPRFDVDAGEVERGGTSYSVDTLDRFAASFPDDERWFLVGADVGRSFAHWREPRRILALARLGVLRRSSGDDADDPQDVLAPFLALAEPSRPLPVVVPTRRVDLSATEVRARVHAGRPLTGFVPLAVAQYIADHRLYHTVLQ